MKGAWLSERWKKRFQSVKHFFVNDWSWKLAAFALALFVFFWIRQSISYTETLILPVETELDRGHLSLKDFEPTTVRVTFRGSEEAIRSLSVVGTEKPRVRLKLSQPPAGQTSMRMTLSPEDVICDRDLRVVKVEPEEVVAHFDRTESRYLNVEEPDLRGLSATDKVKVTLEPSYVTVSGPSERLDELVERSVSLTTEALDVVGRGTTFETVLRVQPPDARSSWTLNPETVKVSVEIIQEEASQTFEAVPVRILQPVEGPLLETEPRVVDVTVSGALSELKAIEKERIFVIVNPPSLDEKTWPVEAKVEALLPYSRHVKSLSVSPHYVNLYQKDQAQEVDPRVLETDKTK